MRAAINHALLQLLVERGEQGPVDAGMVVVFEMKADVEHGQVEKFRDKGGGVTHGMRDGLRHAS